MTTRRSLLQSGAGAVAAFAFGGRSARAANAPGITDTEIRIGQTMPYSGPASAYGVEGKADAVKVNTSPTNYSPIRQMQIATFNGEGWELFGEILEA